MAMMPILCRRESRTTDCSCQLQAASCNGCRLTGTDFGGWRKCVRWTSRLPYGRAFVRLCLLCCHSIFYVYTCTCMCAACSVLLLFFHCSLRRRNRVTCTWVLECPSDISAIFPSVLYATRLADCLSRAAVAVFAALSQRLDGQLFDFSNPSVPPYTRSVFRFW